MARPRSELPRMQKQAPIRAPLAAAAVLAQPVEKPVEVRRAPMMRQYDLVERVRAYNPNTNEALLNRAYVYAMKAHGHQKRASGAPFFSHPLEVAAILAEMDRMTEEDLLRGLEGLPPAESPGSQRSGY